ncbi:SRPBCC family protein [Bradyrhizobium lablabi]|uniref:SRPBCC family protein n=1 Tax=Bradyrhizobium lablabi TaxID=722472 RepID=UPI001BA70104|nr:SRPBCC family protein [Bradyrhizobium lablabi]MBR1126019.1 SRPBCC family protein [Bradyrhizobium lablabi]
MSKPEFVYVIYIHATPEKIWQALINPEMTKEFWGRHRNASDWKPGSPWQHQNYDDANDVSVTGTVVESHPPRRLVLTWASSNSSDVSRVAFDIDEFMGSTKLTVTHSELSIEAMRGISAGWPAVLSSLKTLLETGASLPMTRQHWRKAG